MSEGGWRISGNWRLQKIRYGLVGETCPHCEEKIFPPRDICPDCQGLTVERDKNPVEGQVLFIGDADKQGKRTIMVRLDNGKVGFGDVDVGMENGELTERLVIWQPRQMREFAPAGNQFELLATAMMEINSDAK